MQLVSRPYVRAISFVSEKLSCYFLGWDLDLQVDILVVLLLELEIHLRQEMLSDRRVSSICCEYKVVRLSLSLSSIQVGTYIE